MTKTKTIIAVGAIALVLFLASRKKAEQVEVQDDKGTEKSKVPSMGGGGGGGGGSSIPLAPTLAVPTSQVIVQTQPSTPVATSSPATTTTTTPATGSTASGTTTNQTSGLGSVGGTSPVGGGSTGGSTATTTQATNHFNDFFSIDANVTQSIDALL